MAKRSLFGDRERRQLEEERRMREEYWRSQVEEEDGVFTGVVPIGNYSAQAASLAIDFPDRNQKPGEVVSYLRNTWTERRGDGRTRLRGGSKSFVGYDIHPSRDRYESTREVFEQESGVSVWPAHSSYVRAHDSVRIPEGTIKVVESKPPGYRRPVYNLVMNRFDSKASLPERTWQGLREAVVSDELRQGSIKEGWYIPPH